MTHKNGEIKMGLFDRFKRQPSAYLSDTRQTCGVVDITDILAPGDTVVRRSLEDAMLDPLQFFESYRPSLEDRGLTGSEDETDDIRWLGMVEVLLERGAVCELDFKEPLANFLAAVTSLSGMKRLDLVIDKTALVPDDEITGWCAAIDRQWKGKGCCMGGIDIDSDSYVLFPCRETELRTLSEITKTLSRKITYGTML